MTQLHSVWLDDHLPNQERKKLLLIQSKLVEEGLRHDQAGTA